MCAVEEGEVLEPAVLIGSEVKTKTALNRFDSSAVPFYKTPKNQGVLDIFLLKIGQGVLAIPAKR